jgi:hypothetical protein
MELALDVCPGEIGAEGDPEGKKLTVETIVRSGIGLEMDIA